MSMALLKVVKLGVILMIAVQLTLIWVSVILLKVVTLCVILL
jgi:hypothetical protein